MKTLVIGMDGASVSTFKRGWTPFIESIIENGYLLDLKLDLLSRGWVEIITGKHAIETGALYDFPKLNSTLDWSLNFNIEKIPKFGSETKPIWQVLNERGYKVGIMNVPTTFPAPAVDGFFVSGGGGGAKVIQDASEDLCHPKDIVSYLNSVGYIVDERMQSLIFENNIRSVNEVFARFQKKNFKRTETFIKLSKERCVDFGFVVYKSSSVMVEFFTIPELEREKKGQKALDEKLLQLSKSYYKEFDKQIKKIVDAFPDAEIILVSDHSEIMSKYVVNVNNFLQKNGYQFGISNQKEVMNESLRFLKNFIKPMIPFRIRRVLPGKKIIRQLSYSPVVFDPKKTSAFCMPMGDWSRGIYINDKNRFNGIVDSKNITDMSHEISSAINNDDLAKKHGIRSHVKPFTDTLVSQLYPDIVLDLPDGYIVRNNKKGFISSFTGYTPYDFPGDTIEGYARDPKPYCVRGNAPIAISTKKWTSEILNLNSDLTAIYRHLLMEFK